MTLRRIRFLGVSVIVLLLPLLGGCLTAKGSGGSSREDLLMPFFFEDGKLAWTPTHSGGDHAMRTNQFRRVGDKAEKWSELITVVTLNKAADVGSVEQEFEAYKERVTGRCRDSVVKVVREMPDGIVYEAEVKGCESGNDEHLLVRMIDGKSNFFIVQYVTSGAVQMTDQRRSKWVGELVNVTITGTP